MTEPSPAPIHTLPIPDVFARLGTSPAGLPEDEARLRRERLETGAGPVSGAFPWRYLRAAPFGLWAAALLTFSAGRDLTALVLVLGGAALLAAGIALDPPGRMALPAVAALPHARILRPRHSAAEAAGAVVPAVVPGDVIALYEGDVVPADARLVQAAGLVVSAAPLSGDPHPRVCTADPVTEPVVGGDLPPNLVSAGMRVLAGTGRAVVFATGPAAEPGRLAAGAGGEVRRLSPLGAELAWLGDRLTGAATGLALVAGFVGLVAFDAARAALTAALILAAAVPATLVLVAAAGLALLAGRLRREGLHARSLSALDTLGAATVVLAEVRGRFVPRLPGALRLALTSAGPIAALGRAHDGGLAFGSEDERAPRVVPASSLDAVTDTELLDCLAGDRLVVAASGEQKAALVTRLQAAGHVVAMRGDLLGDLPALRRADVTVASGEEQSPAVQASADIVVAGPGTAAALEQAVPLARHAYGGLHRAALLIVAGIVPALAAALPAVFGAPPALGIAQLLALRTGVELPLALGLALTPGGQPLPRGRYARLRSPATLQQAALLGAAQAALVLIVFFSLLASGGWPPGELGALGSQWAIPAPAVTPTIIPTPLAPGVPLPLPTPTATPAAGAAAPAGPASTPGAGGQGEAAPDPGARAALARAQAGVMVTLALLQVGLAFALALSAGTRWQAALLPLLPAAGASLLALLAMLGIEPLARGLEIAWPGTAPWAFGLSAAMVMVLTAVAWRLIREEE